MNYTFMDCVCHPIFVKFKSVNKIIHFSELGFGCHCFKNFEMRQDSD